MSIINQPDHIHVSNVIVDDNPNQSKYKDWYAVKPNHDNIEMELPEDEDLKDIILGEPGGDTDDPNNKYDGSVNITTDMVTCVNIRNKTGEEYPLNGDILSTAINKLVTQFQLLKTENEQLRSELNDTRTLLLETVKSVGDIKFEVIDGVLSITGNSSNTTHTIWVEKTVTGMYDRLNMIFYEDLGDGTYKVYDVIETGSDGRPTKMQDTGETITREELPSWVDPTVQTTITSSILTTLKGIYDSENKKFYEDLGDGTYKEYDVETDEKGNLTGAKETGNVLPENRLPDTIRPNNKVILPGSSEIGSNPPDNKEMTWIDTSNGKGVFKYWNGTSWVATTSVWVDNSMPSDRNLTWIDTSVNGVYKYWNGTSWVSVKSTWGPNQ